MARKKKESSDVVVPVETHEPVPCCSEPIQQSCDQPAVVEVKKNGIQNHKKFSKFKKSEGEKQ